VSPSATAVHAFAPPVTSVGTSVPEPGAPSCPSELSPQHSSSPDDVIPHDERAPAPTATHGPASSATEIGV